MNTKKFASDPRVVLRADVMNEAHVGRLRAACRGWAEFVRVPEAAESPLWDPPNVLLTSHSAGWSPQLPHRLCDLFVENLENLRDAGLFGMSSNCANPLSR